MINCKFIIVNFTFKRKLIIQLMIDPDRECIKSPKNNDDYSHFKSSNLLLISLFNREDTMYRDWINETGIHDDWAT